MSEEIPRLPDEHLDRAREIVAEKRTRQKCKSCYDRGYIGTNQNNLLAVPDASLGVQMNSVDPNTLNNKMNL